MIRFVNVYNAFKLSDQQTPYYSTVDPSSHTTGGVEVNSTFGTAGSLILETELKSLGSLIRVAEADPRFAIRGRLSNQPVPDSVWRRGLAGRP